MRVVAANSNLKGFGGFPVNPQKKKATKKAIPEWIVENAR
jgi:hypothetical protein